MLFFEEASDDGGGHATSADKCNFYGHVFSAVREDGLSRDGRGQSPQPDKSKWVSEYRGDAAIGVVFEMNVSFEVTNGMTSYG